jgi:4-aminobutyrate aminotransferase-like enzyme
VAAEATEEEREKLKVNAEVDVEVVAEVAPLLMMEDAFVVTVVGSEAVERAMRMAVRVVILVVVAAMAMVCVPL